MFEQLSCHIFADVKSFSSISEKIRHAASFNSIWGHIARFSKKNQKKTGNVQGMLEHILTHFCVDWINFEQVMAMKQKKLFWINVSRKWMVMMPWFFVFWKNYSLPFKRVGMDSETMKRVVDTDKTVIAQIWNKNHWRYNGRVLRKLSR